MSGGSGIGRAWEGFARRARGAGGTALLGAAAGGASALRELLREGARGGVRTLRVHRRARYVALAVALGAPLLGGGWLWLRGSSLVRVEHVAISGVRGPQAAQIEAALRESARSMSTMDFELAKLRDAVAARFPQVDELRATASFPHSVRIVVGEQPAAAALVVDGVRTAVAADGVVLGTQLLSSSQLPEVADNYEPAVGQQVSNGLVRAALTVLGAEPAQLRAETARAYYTPRGLTVAMRSGLLVYFGDETRPHAKWLALARVLADPSSANATYVDVRLPERPAAAVGEATSTSEGSSAESTVQTLAHGLKGKEPEEEASTHGAAESGAQPSGEHAAQGGSEEGGEAQGEASSAGSAGSEGSEASG